jgi:hypothetical protein
MKFSIFALLLTLASGAVQASDGFAPRYTLDSFKIASGTLSLKGMGSVTDGTVDINTASNELRLTLQREMVCPAQMFCPTVMPVPTLLTLPIRSIENTLCKGITITAERDLLPLDGLLTRVVIEDSNGSLCAENADRGASVKRVKVLVVEQGPRDAEATLSVLSGFPLNR